MTDTTNTVSPADYGAAMLYEAMADRVAQLPDDWSIAMMAARLHCKRVGLDQFMQELMTKGVAEVAAKCRAEMMVRHHFFVRMLAEHPGADPADVIEAAEELANDLAVFDHAETSMRLLKFLDRLQRREFRLQSINIDDPH